MKAITYTNAYFTTTPKTTAGVPVKMPAGWEALDADAWRPPGGGNIIKVRRKNGAARYFATVQRRTGKVVKLERI